MLSLAENAFASAVPDYTWHAVKGLCHGCHVHFVVPKSVFVLNYVIIFKT